MTMKSFRVLKQIPVNLPIFYRRRVSTVNHPDVIRVVVTGLGIVCPLGVGVKYVWNRLIRGECATSGLQEPEYKDLPCKVAAFVPKGDKEGELNVHKTFKPSELKSISLGTVYGLIAAEEALKDANWLPDDEGGRKCTGVAVGTGMVDLLDILRSGNALFNEGYNKLSPFFIPRILGNMSAGHISIRYGFKGPNHCVSTACTTGAHAVGDAFNFIRYGHASVMVCGGTEAVISPLSIAGFSRIRALSTKFNSHPSEASRPFDKDRDGFVMGEGAGILILESLEHAVKRKAKIYAEVVGYGLSGDAHHITNPSPDGRGAILSMSSALERSGFDYRDVYYINAHATSTPLGDAIELIAIQNVFKNHSKNLIVSSTKGATGHLLGAAGSIEAIFTILACHTGKIPLTVNLHNTDPKSEIFIVSKSGVILPKSHSGNCLAMTNSFGFGGTNASLIFKSYHDLKQ